MIQARHDRPVPGRQRPDHHGLEGLPGHLRQGQVFAVLQKYEALRLQARPSAAVKAQVEVPVVRFAHRHIFVLRHVSRLDLGEDVSSTLDDMGRGFTGRLEFFVHTFASGLGTVIKTPPKE